MWPCSLAPSPAMAGMRVQGPDVRDASSDARNGSRSRTPGSRDEPEVSSPCNLRIG